MKNNDCTTARLHPYRQRMRHSILITYKNTLDAINEPGINYLNSARVVYLSDAIRSFTVDMPDIAMMLLQRGRLCLEYLFSHNIKPMIGWDPISFRPFWDDVDLNYHWLVIYKTKFRIDLLLDGTHDERDLDKGMSHFEKLLINTDNLSGDIEVNRETLLIDFLLVAAYRNSSDRAMESIARSILPRAKPSTRLNFAHESCRLKFLLMISHYACGEKEFEKPVRAAFADIFDIHNDLEHELERTCWSGVNYAFEWSWLWECLFEATPCAQRAIDRISGKIQITKAS